jgi:ATP-dependent helicase Lhr and Lhr-like helicase
VADYRPELLDQLSFTGRVAWARAAQDGSRALEGPIRTTPIALFPREQLHELRAGASDAAALSLTASKVQAALAARGASFVGDLARASGLDRREVEEGLGELAARGLATSDGFMGLRALLSDVERTRGRRGEAGRYCLLDADARLDLERLAQLLLRRWGVLFRKLVERESLPISWGLLVRVLRQLEDRGEVRGGRFVTGFGGEQFALPDAVSAMRRLRKTAPSGELVEICGCDPLNLVGLITPGAHVPCVPSARVLLCDGLPVAAVVAGQCRWLGDHDDAFRQRCARALGILVAGERDGSRAHVQPPQRMGAPAP